MHDRIVGILGGGQLGRMLAAAASLLNIPILILDSGNNSPAKQVVSPSEPRSHIDGSFADPENIRKLAAQADVLTIEIEHVNADILDEIANSNSKIQIHPSPLTIKIIQNKYIQKLHLTKNGIPVAEYQQVQPNAESIREAISSLGLPLMLKSQTLAYDGRGNFVVKTQDQVDEALQALNDRPLYAEKWAPFVKEIAVMVVRSASGEVVSYPTVETVQKDNICHLVFAPLRSPDGLLDRRARSVAEKAVRTFDGAGVFGVEMFLMPDGGILLNEIAPRPHNSGHYTIEACHTSQYENHLRAILSFPLGSTSMRVPSAAMLNLIGASSDKNELNNVCEAALSVPGASVHLYGKAECRKGRKMGHITVVGESDAEVRDKLRPLLRALPNGDEALTALHAPPTPRIGFSHPFPLVGIIMGSDSDLPVMRVGAQILDKFQIPYELTIVSAHRTPDRLVSYAREAASRGVRVIVAGAGGAAHLPGMVASMTSLPVIGVPVKGSALDGVDSLHSMVQMPRGIPVATVAIGNATNAALLAIRILGSTNPDIQRTMDGYLEGLKQDTMAKAYELAKVGWEQYEIKKI